MRKINRAEWQGPRKITAAVLAALLMVPPGSIPAVWAASAVTVDSLEAGDDQVKIHLSGETEYNAFVTANPPRVVIQLVGADYQAGARSLAGKGKYLKGVRAGQFQRAPSMVSRVVLDLNEMTGYRVAKNGSDLTVLLGPAASAAPADSASAAKPAAAAADSSSDESADNAGDSQSDAAADSGPAKHAVGEGGGMTTKYSSELAAVARTGDATKERGGEALKDAAASPPSATTVKLPPGDIMSQLPRDPVSLDFDNTDVKDVMKLLAAKARINVIYGPDVIGTLTLHLVDVPFNEAFRTTLSMMNLSTMQVGRNILRVLTPAALVKSQQAAATATRVIALNYAKASDLMPTITQVRTAEGRTGTTIADQKTNSLIVTESLEGLSSTERLISQLDVRPKQVLIEVKLVEVGLNNSLNYGIQWDYQSVDHAKIGGQSGTNLNGTIIPPLNAGGASSTPMDQNALVVPGVGAGGRGTGVSLPASTVFGALTLGRITNNYFLSATLTAAAAQGKVKVLSDPKVATLNNQPATINVTTSIPYTTSNVASTGVQTQTVTYAITGIQLTVTPTINADGRITLQVSPNVSQPSATAAASVTTGAPAIDARTANTTVLVRDGETIVIGGLISDSVSNQIAKIPILGDIPILGWLFKKKSVTRTRSELLIFVTPKVMSD